MSIKDLWQLLKKKGYKTLYLPQQTTATTVWSMFLQHFDEVGDQPEEVMFRKLANALSEVLDPDNSVLYIDGSDVQEKQETHKIRKQAREDAAAAAGEALDRLQERLDGKVTPRKQEHVDARKNIQRTFRFTTAGREACRSTYRMKVGWYASGTSRPMSRLPRTVAPTT
jgi:hypothetical protein